jgi:hypothetical protein
MRREGIATILRNTTFIGSFYTCGIYLTIGAEILRDLIDGIISETNLYIIKVNIIAEEILSTLGNSNHSNIIYVPVVDIIAILTISSKTDFEGREGVGVYIFDFGSPWNITLCIIVIAESVPRGSVPYFYGHFFEGSRSVTTEIDVVFEVKTRGSDTSDIRTCKRLVVVGDLRAPVELSAGSRQAYTCSNTPVGTS